MDTDTGSDAVKLDMSDTTELDTAVQKDETVSGGTTGVTEDTGDDRLDRKWSDSHPTKHLRERLVSAIH